MSRSGSWLDPKARGRAGATSNWRSLPTSRGYSRPNTAVRDLVGVAFRARGLEPPRLGVTTYSMQLRMQLLATGRYLTVFPASLMKYNAERWSLKALPVDLGNRLPVVIVTLKNRTLTPAVQLFIKFAKAEGAAMHFPAGRD